MIAEAASVTEVIHDLMDRRAVINMPTPPRVLIRLAVAKEFEVALTDLMGPSRRQDFVDARMVAMLLFRILLNDSPGKIDAYFSKKHGAARNAIERTLERMLIYRGMRLRVLKLEAALRKELEQTKS